MYLVRYEWITSRIVSCHYYFLVLFFGIGWGREGFTHTTRNGPTLLARWMRCKGGSRDDDRRPRLLRTMPAITCRRDRRVSPAQTSEQI